MQARNIIPIFFVADVDDAVAFYAKTLGFAEAFRYGTYAGLNRDGFELHITDPGEPRQIAGSGTAYVICDEVDEYFAEVKAKGAKIKTEPADRSYGMRDFAIFDPDGNQLTFGCDAEQD